MKLGRRGIAAVIAVFAGVLVACAPPQPIVNVIVVDAGEENWQSQVAGESPGADIRVREGDTIAIEATGQITYGRNMLGLTREKSGPWGEGTPRETGTCPDARTGALIWRVADGPCMSLDDVSNSTFVADRDGVLQFMVNDHVDKYGDNGGSFRVTVTITR